MLRTRHGHPILGNKKSFFFCLWYSFKFSYIKKNSSSLMFPGGFFSSLLGFQLFVSQCCATENKQTGLSSSPEAFAVDPRARYAPSHYFSWHGFWQPIILPLCRTNMRLLLSLHHRESTFCCVIWEFKNSPTGRKKKVPPQAFHHGSQESPLPLSPRFNNHHFHLTLTNVGPTWYFKWDVFARRRPTFAASWAVMSTTQSRRLQDIVSR